MLIRGNKIYAICAFWDFVVCFLEMCGMLSIVTWFVANDYSEKIFSENLVFNITYVVFERLLHVNFTKMIVSRK